jgi:dTDP-4-dehydrorhamnose 3,5-epimerase
MQVIKTAIEGVVEVLPDVFGDERGYFFESYNRDKFVAAGITEVFLQDNQSFSVKGVLRGLHFQKEPYAQGKLVRVVSGSVLDVVVDLRKDSPTFGQHVSVVLTAEKNNMLYVPPGMAHGFATLKDAIFSYKCTNVFHKASEGGVLWNDPKLNIDWQLENPVVSEKDQILPTFDITIKDLYGI